jgi:Putative DNA-binding domain
MSAAPRSTEQLQHWLQTVITHHAGVAAGVNSDAARAAIPFSGQSIESVILPSRSQSSLERLAVYGNAYYVRLLHCLRDLFPACRYAVGDEAFGEFACGYLQSYPPHGYTLGTLADHFVTFLDQTRQEHFAGEPVAEPSAEEFSATHVEDCTRFLVELARLEFTIDQVFDGPGIEDHPPQIYDQLRAVPREDWPAIRLTPAPCLRLLEFDFPVNDYFTAFRRDESPEPPEPRKSYLAVTRRDFVVRRYRLNSMQHALLAAIVSGATIADAIATVAAKSDDADQLLPRLSQWFSNWAREEFFVRLETSFSNCIHVHGGTTHE